MGSATTSTALQVSVPQHRMTPLKAHWMSLYEPVTQNMKLDMRMNLKSKKVGSVLVSRVLHCTLTSAAHDGMLSCPSREYQSAG